MFTLLPHINSEFSNSPATITDCVYVIYRYIAYRGPPFISFPELGTSTYFHVAKLLHATIHCSFHRLKVASATFLLVCFLGLNGHLSNYKKWFLFHFKSSFRSKESQILEFQIFQFHDVIKCLSIIHEIHFTE